MRRWAAWIVACGAAAVFLYGAAVAPASAGFAWTYVVPFTAVCSIPAILRPRNPTSWYLLGLIGLAVALPWLLEATAVGLVLGGEAVGILVWHSTVNPLLAAAGGICGMLMLAGLPDGRVPVGGRGAVATMAAILVGVEVAGILARPLTSLDFVDGPATINPLFVESLRWLSDPFGVDTLSVTRMIAVPAAMFLGFLIAIQRFGSSDERTRRRIRWVFYGTGVALTLGIAIVVLDAEGPPPANDMIAAIRYLPLYALPISVALAVEEPRWLSDRDEQARRSAIYTMISLAIIVAYLAIPSALGLTAGSRVPQEVAIVAAVLLTAAMHPLGRWLRRRTDRAVFGQPDPPIEVILEEVEAGGEGLAPAVAETVRSTLRLRWVRCRIEDTSATAGVPDTEPSRVIPLEHDGSTLGVIECGPGVGRPLTAADWDMLRTLAQSIALAIANAQLANRIVLAQDAERRRIERNIHDGAQQDVVAMIARLGVARAKLTSGTLTEDDIIDLQQEATRVVDELHELSQGIHPAVLTDGGLGMAVRERCARSPVPVDLTIDPSSADPSVNPDVAGAVYFLVSESLTNVLKHAEGATAIEVEIRRRGETIQVSVVDDGPGLPGPTPLVGGLAGLRDRLSALGGTLVVREEPSGGTRVTGSIPVMGRP